MIEDYLRKRANLLNVFVLIDSRHKPQQNDLAFVNQLGRWNVPFNLVLQKADKEKPGVVQRNVQTFLDTMKLTWQFCHNTSFQALRKKPVGKKYSASSMSAINAHLKRGTNRLFRNPVQ